MSLTLTAEELTELTGKKNAKAQASRLTEMGLPFRAGPVRPLVSRDAASAWLRGDDVRPRSTRGPRLDLIR